MDRDLRRQTIQRMLMQSAGVAAPPRAIADAVLGLWDQLASRLVPVIGARGVEALFDRALHLTGKTFPTFAACMAGGSVVRIVVSPESVIARIALCDPAGAVEGGEELLVTFVDMLATLIGESLTERLLSTVWTCPPPNAESEVES